MSNADRACEIEELDTMAPNRSTRMGRTVVGLVAGIALGVAPIGKARAQSACGQLGVDCSHPVSSGPPSRTNAVADEAAMREQLRLELDAAMRAGQAERERALRRANDRGIAAYKSREWDLAVNYFQGALLLDPSNALVAENLRKAREQQAIARARRERDAEQLRLARFLASGPTVPLPGTGAVVVGQRWSGDDLAPAMPNAYDRYKITFDILRHRARDAVASRVRDSIDVMTPEGLFLRVQGNVVTLSDKTFEWILSAASGTMSADEGNMLTNQAAAILFNVGHPEQFLNDMLEFGSAKVAAMKLFEAELTEGIASTVATFGATMLYPHGAPGSARTNVVDSAKWQGLHGVFKRMATIAVREGVVDKWAKDPNASAKTQPQ